MAADCGNSTHESQNRKCFPVQLFYVRTDSIATQDTGLGVTLSNIDVYNAAADQLPAEVTVSLVSNP